MRRGRWPGGIRRGKEAGRSGPKAEEVERELPMMFDGKKNDPGAPQQIEDQIFLDHKLPEVVSFFHPRLQLPKQRPAFSGTDRMRQKGPAGLRIPPQHWN